VSPAEAGFENGNGGWHVDNDKLSHDGVIECTALVRRGLRRARRWLYPSSILDEIRPDGGKTPSPPTPSSRREHASGGERRAPASLMTRTARSSRSPRVLRWRKRRGRPGDHPLAHFDPPGNLGRRRLPEWVEASQTRRPRPDRYTTARCQRVNQEFGRVLLQMGLFSSFSNP